MPPVALGGLGHRAVRRIGVGQGNGQELGLVGQKGIDHRRIEMVATASAHDGPIDACI